MDAVAVMAPGRFRRRLSDDHSDIGEPPGETGSPTAASETTTQTRTWQDGTGSTRGRLPWLSPRERRHPLRDVRLSCFRSYLPGSIGGSQGSQGSADGDVLCKESSPRSPKTPRTPRLAGKDKEGRGLSLSVRRSPGRSRGSKTSDNVYLVNPRPQQPENHPSPQPPAKHSGHGVNLSARLRALSARCLALVHANKATITSHDKHDKRPCKQRSFSSGALPGLHDFQRRQLNPIYLDDGDEQTPLSPSPSNGVVGGDGDEDCDSGILVSEATSTPLSSLPGCGGNRAGRGSLPWGGGMGVGALGTATAASRALRSASLDRELLGGSPLLDHEEDPDEPDAAHGAYTSQARRSRASTKSSSSSSEISEIFSRFQRRRVAGTPTSSPPLLPAPPQRSGAGSGEGATAGSRRREFHLVRLTRSAPTEELGIFIAKTDAPDRGAQGYLVAHIVPGGLAHRDGQLCLGDELVVVNGRQLRGLSMAAARLRLRAGPTQVDIVIARPSAVQCRCQNAEGRDSGLDTSGSGDSMTACCCKAPDHTPSPARRTLPESSVDYENVVLRPRDRTPILSSGESAADRTSPSTAPSPSQRTTPPSAPTASSATTDTTVRVIPTPSSSPQPRQLFQKHAAPTSVKAARRSLALVSRSSSPPLESLESPERPAETQHHSLKRRGRRHGGRSGHGHDGGSEFHVELRKGPGCGALGFTVVGGADSPRGALPIFVRSVLEGGQAAQDGRLQPGDELLLLNGQPLRGASHSEAVAMFRAVRAGPVVLTVCRRTTKKAQSCSDLVVGPEGEGEGEAGQAAVQQRDDD